MCHQKLKSKLLWLCIAASLWIACGESNDNVLAPYAGQRDVSDIAVEENSYQPRLTWAGGYVSILGVNEGDEAKLDSTLIMLVEMDSDDVRFPVKFGEVPAGASEITSRYGGHALPTLTEDRVYTYWVMKKQAWDLVQQHNNMVLVEDPDASELVRVNGDTVLIDSEVHSQLTLPIDQFINISDVRSFGRLANLEIVQPTVSPDIVVSWTIKQDGVTDSLVAATGLVEGQQYTESKVVWETWSEENVGGSPVYGKKNVIASPMVLGQEFPETRVFFEFPAEGLRRGTFYYVWIGAKEWDGAGRLRSTPYYAYLTFRAW